MVYAIPRTHQQASLRDVRPLGIRLRGLKPTATISLSLRDSKAGAGIPLGYHRMITVRDGTASKSSQEQTSRKKPRLGEL